MGHFEGRIKKIERASREDLASFELLDGSRYFYDPLEVAKALFLHGLACLTADAASEWPVLPEIYARMLEARDPAGVLGRFFPSDELAWFTELPYDRDVLISERRLEPVPTEPIEDLSEP
jgi:hypothetical protein